MINNRELVPIEQAMEILNRQAGSFNVVTISRVKGPLTEEVVRQALNLVQCRHQRLNCRIVGSLDSLRFETEGTQKIPLRVVSEGHKEQWEEIVLEELNVKIDSSQCLVRAALVRLESESSTSYLITAVHHAITDGLSSIRLHSEILSYCQRLACGQQITQVASLSPLPKLEELFPESVRGLRGAVKGVLLLLRLKFQLLLHRPETLGFEKCVPTELRRCGWVTRRLDEELTQQIVKICRQEKTTVQAALCAALMFAAARRISGGKTRDVRVFCRSAADVRRRLNPAVSDENMGILASSLNSFCSLRANTSFWELARDVRQQLEAGLERGDIFSSLLMSRKITESVLARPNEVPGTVFVTNVGRVNIPTAYGPFELEEISYVPAQAAFGGILGAAVTTFRGKMVFNFMFSEPSISRDTMEILANSVVFCLADACKEKVGLTLMG
ncbi:phthiocerol/phthiodiolone dimycocerosyl transferase family protein [Kamptonema formosum]|uniref:phthiocerol/phthiodiolone dimycocerosyl transferase family protein n=1 Tax=Kamptonema formosum TaxID=331992 RepID=UPI0012DD41A4|nr:condensation domain-containing protein [Oscillatoria sp. PCC 10802]